MQGSPKLGSLGVAGGAPPRAEAPSMATHPCVSPAMPRPRHRVFSREFLEEKIGQFTERRNENPGEFYIPCFGFPSALRI
jgi:hypothetical protein